MDEHTQQQQPSDRWVHRRRMAYSALVGVYGTALGAFLVPALPATQASLLETIVLMLGGVVGTYVGGKIIGEAFGKR